MKTSKIIWTQGLKVYALIFVYFIVMKLLGLHENVELRMLNFIFVFWGINGALKINYNINNDVSYLSNFSLGIQTAALSVILSAVSLVLYISFIDPHFITILNMTHIWGSGLSLPQITLAIFIEGFASSVICSFILMQYWKGKKPIMPTATQKSKAD